MKSYLPMLAVLLLLLLKAVRSEVPSCNDDMVYDHDLTEFILEVLENFRDQMAEGIEGLGIPPVDPLTIPEVDEDIVDLVAQILMRMRNVTISGISGFQIHCLKADLEKGFVDVSLSLPDLTADGFCYVDGKVIGIFPVNGNGPFHIGLENISVSGHGELNISFEGETRLHMNDLKLNLTFGSLDIQFESFLGGARWTQTLIKMLTGLGPKLFDYFQEEAMARLNEALLIFINNELDKGTLKELIDNIPLPS